MPNNQDAVKLLPLRGGWHFTKEGDDYYLTSPEGSYSNGYSASYTLDMANAFAAAMNTPTPREQELEAQNKALWELVEQCNTALREADIHCGGLTKITGRPQRLAIVDLTIVAIQKAKEVKVPHQYDVEMYLYGLIKQNKQKA
jgi:hypothetical protein